MTNKALLYWHTVRHLAFSQVLWRGWYTLRRGLGLYRSPRPSSRISSFNRVRLRTLRAYLEHCHAAGIHAGTDVDALRGQSFSFLGRCVENTGTIPWADTTLSRLWRYHLHGFSFGRDFAVNAAGDAYLGDRDRALHWMRDWIARNPVGADVAWDAYPTSERLLNWALLAAVFEIQEQDIVGEVQRQALWLEKWLEYDVRANHLLKNAVALFTAAALLDDAPLLRRAERLLETQIQEQILDDGCHYERSLMYHCHVLWDLLVARALIQSPSAGVDAAVLAMTRCLALLRHPDGDIPLFGDAARSARKSASTLVTLVQRLFPEETFHGIADNAGVSLTASGFFGMGDGAAGNWMWAKTAPPSPPCQPGHSHGDMLSFELSIAGRRMIVDGGVHGYAESELRAYCRSARAHNTVQVNEIEQSEMWGVFRVARRPVALTPEFHCDPDTVSLTAGYTHYSGYVHTRRIDYDVALRRWTIRDDVTGLRPDDVVCSRVHFHPECVLTRVDDRIEARRDGASLALRVSEGASADIYATSAEGLSFWYCPEFGAARFAPTVVIHAAGGDAARLGYEIVPDR